MNDLLPIWLTAQLCIVLYLVAIIVPYFFSYLSHKRYRSLIENAITRYTLQRRRQEERLKRQQEQKQNAIRKQCLMKSIQYQNNMSSSSSSEAEESTESSEEEEEIDIISEIGEKNTHSVLEQYKNNIVDLFDGQASITSSAAATTIMVQAPKRPNRVLHI